VLNSGEPTGKYSNLIVFLFSARYFPVILEQCGVALSTNTIHLPNLFCICFKQSTNVTLLNSSYCLNNCLPSKDRQPNTIVLLREPVTVTIGLFPAEIHFFLLTI
jgi:hypothetical protein